MNKLPQDLVIKNLVFFFLLVNPDFSPIQIYQVWQKHIVLKEYDRPELDNLGEWYDEFIAEREILLENLAQSKNVYD